MFVQKYSQASLLALSYRLAAGKPESPKLGKLTWKIRKGKEIVGTSEDPKPQPKKK